MDRAIIQTPRHKNIQKKLLVTGIWSLWIFSFVLGLACAYRDNVVKPQISTNVNKVEVQAAASSNTSNTTGETTTTKTYQYANLSGKTIVVDAGHGGADPGTHGASTGILECDINM